MSSQYQLAADSYVRRIRNDAKRAYAENYLAFLRGRIPNEPDSLAYPLSYMGAHRREKMTQTQNRLEHFYQCGICGAWHNDRWHGDCRQDNARFTIEEIEAKHGEEGVGWIEVPMVPEEEDEPA